METIKEMIEGAIYTDKNGNPKRVSEGIMNVGNNVASEWGGSCYDYEVDMKNKSIIFLCIEYGEKFITELAFNELERYDY